MPKFNDFTDISNILDDYSNDIYESMKEAAKENAQEGVNELKKVSPKRTGDYRKGWRKKDWLGVFKYGSTIHNATDYQLTHLLEKPHAKRGGGRTTPKVHISPVEKKYSDKYYQDCIDIIKKGGK